MNKEKKTIVASMKPRQMGAWSVQPNNKRRSSRVYGYLAAGIICLCAGVLALSSSGDAVSVMNQLSTGFEYDDTLGRLQYVSNILPESAMVFLADDTGQITLSHPTDGRLLHEWSQQEPWLEYENAADVCACSDGEIMTVVKNRNHEYTVRMLHEGGYESIYSGLSSVNLQESDQLAAGERIGLSGQNLSFEVRKDGLSVMPVFSQSSPQP